MVVIKFNDRFTQKSQDRLLDHIGEFFHGIGEEGEFEEKVSGYCVIYAPLAVHLIETDDGEYLEKIMASLHAATQQKEGNMIEAVWVPF
jgi:hypothetical protein